MISFCLEPETRIIRNLSFADYVALPGLNQSLAKTHDPNYEGCPALFRWKNKIGRAHV